MTFSEQYIESAQSELQARVQVAMCKSAQNIGAEDPGTANHGARVSLASQVARQPSMFTPSFTSMLCAQGITRQSTDAEIENMVSAVWNTMAGGSLA